MAQIKNKNTKPEIFVRRLLHQQGYRFRLHQKNLPGTPDIILPKYKTVIFVHGCFWHRHPNCADASTPKTRTEFWQKKFAMNVERDKRNQQKLCESGWHVIIVWECEIINQKDLSIRLNKELGSALQQLSSSSPAS
jgi:DNA mismatch endonuclease (patch repair protein)